VRRRWLIGSAVGAAAGLGTLVAGTIGGLLGFIVIALAIAEPPRAPAVGGVLVGFGASWLALFGRVALTCRQDCVAPDYRPWLFAAGILAGLGILVTVRARRPG
jgi:hypothetical protein